MMRGTIAGLALLLCGCTDEGFNPIVLEAVKQVNPLDSEAEPKPSGPTITRAAITRSDVATIRARLLTDEVPSYLFAASDNGGFVTFASGLRQTLTLRGAQLTATRGLGWDLLSATSSQPDPLTRAIPPAAWPSGVTRSYEFPANAPQGRIETFDCRFEFGAVTEVVILEVRHRGVEVAEICTGPSGNFENLHLADLNTGFVWRSVQWSGPRQGEIDIEIVEPLTRRRG